MLDLDKSRIDVSFLLLILVIVKGMNSWNYVQENETIKNEFKRKESRKGEGTEVYFIVLQWVYPSKYMSHHIISSENSFVFSLYPSFLYKLLL